MWEATDDMIFVIQFYPQVAIPFHYTIEADTLDMAADYMGDNIRFRMLPDDLMP
jgi:hypothetical protein